MIIVHNSFDQKGCACHSVLTATDVNCREHATSSRLTKAVCANKTSENINHNQDQVSALP